MYIFKKEKKKREEFLGLLFSQKLHDSAIILENGTNAHSKMVLEGLSADRACRKLLHTCIYRFFPQGGDSVMQLFHAACKKKTGTL